MLEDEADVRVTVGTSVTVLVCVITVVIVDTVVYELAAKLLPLSPAASTELGNTVEVEYTVYVSVNGT